MAFTLPCIAWVPMFRTCVHSCAHPDCVAVGWGKASLISAQVANNLSVVEFGLHELPPQMHIFYFQYADMYTNVAAACPLAR